MNFAGTDGGRFLTISSKVDSPNSNPKWRAGTMQRLIAENDDVTYGASHSASLHGKRMQWVVSEHLSK